MAALVGFIALLAGVVATGWGYRRHQYHQVIDDTPTSRVLDVSEPGLVELSGEARPIDSGDGHRTITAPLSGQEALVAGWHVEEWQSSGKSSSWQDVGDGYDSVPFLLDDGSATIRVEPRSRASGAGFLTGVTDTGSLPDSVRQNGTTIDFDSMSLLTQLEPDESRPDRITEFELTAPGIDEQTGALLNVIDIGNAHGERKYFEGTIDPGDEVYLLGTVEPKTGDADGRYQRLHPEDAVVTPAGDDPFVLSGRSEDEILSGTQWGTPAFLLGLGLLIVGIVALVGF